MNKHERKKMDSVIQETYPSSFTRTDHATHYNIISKSFFQVPVNDIESFWIKYCEAIKTGQSMYIAEVIPNTTQSIQLGFDIFFAFERSYMSLTAPAITQIIANIHEYVKRIISIVQSSLNNFFKTETSECMACYLTRSDDYILTFTPSQVEYKGRIVFPYAFVQRIHIEQFYRAVMSQLQLQSSHLNTLFEVPLINGLDTLFKPITLEHNVLYGSCDKFDEQPLRLVHIYGYLSNYMDVPMSIDKAFIPQMHNLVKTGHINQATLEYYSNMYGLGFWLPLFFTLGYYSKTIIDRGSFILPNSMPKITIKTIQESGDNQSKMERIRTLLSMIDVNRVEADWSWYDIGQAIFSVDSGPTGLALWKYVTMRSDYKDENDCEEKWYTFTEDSMVTMATIEWFAYKDNPKQFEQFYQREVKTAIAEATSNQQETPIAKAFRACFPFEFACASFENSIWFYYTSSHWVQDDGTAQLITYLTKKFVPRLEAYRAELTRETSTNSYDVEAKSRNENTIGQLTELIKKLNGGPFKERLCRDLRIQYYNPQFSKYMDSDPHFTGCINGVIDLRSGEYVFRQGKPEDYITLSTGKAFPMTYTWETPVVQDTLRYIEQVFRSPSLRDYFWRFMGKILYSGNIDKVFPIWSGDGNNSKSMLVRLIECALGKYAMKIPCTLLTEVKKDADKPNPSMARSRGRKIAFAQEPTKDQNMQSGTIKELTGHDSMYIRDLFQKGSQVTEIEVSITICLITNRIPDIKDCQKAIWERTQVVTFSSQWSHNAPEDPNEQYNQGRFKMDNRFEEKLVRLGPAFLWIMANKYKEYYEQGLNPPPEVTNDTNSFKQQNNKIYRYMDQCIVTVGVDGNLDLINTSVCMTLDELYGFYKEWYKAGEWSERISNKIQFKEDWESINNRKFTVDNRWYGVRINPQYQPYQAGPSTGTLL